MSQNDVNRFAAEIAACIEGANSHQQIADNARGYLAVVSRPGHDPIVLTLAGNKLSISYGSILRTVDLESQQVEPIFWRRMVNELTAEYNKRTKIVDAIATECRPHGWRTERLSDHAVMFDSPAHPWYIELFGRQDGSIVYFSVENIILEEVLLPWDAKPQQLTDVIYNMLPRFEALSESLEKN